MREELLGIFSTLRIFTTSRSLNLNSFLWTQHPEVYASYARVRTLRIENDVVSYVDHFDEQRAALFPQLECIRFVDVRFDDVHLNRLVEHLLVARGGLRRVEFRGSKFEDGPMTADTQEVVKQRLKDEGIEAMFVVR